MQGLVWKTPEPRPLPHVGENCDATPPPAIYLYILLSNYLSALQWGRLAPGLW